MRKNIKSINIIICIISLMPLSPILGQKSFKEVYKNSNPVEKELNYSLEKTIELHQTFLEQAKQTNDSLQQVLGYLYLARDYESARDYPKAIALLIAAEQIAIKLNKTHWKAYINHYRGNVYSYLEDHEKTIQYFTRSLEESYEVRDSEFIAFNLEQLASNYGYNRQFKLSHQYYEKAFPLIKKHTRPQDLGYSLSNYGNILSFEGRRSDAVKAYEESIAILAKLGDKKYEILTKGNLADEYYEMGEYDKAQKLLHDCLKESLNNNWRLIELDNYGRLAKVYKAVGNAEKALFYHEKYTHLDDTINGVDVVREINELEVANEFQQKDLIQEKTQVNLVSTQSKLEKIRLLAIIGFIFLLSIIWLVIRKRKRVSTELKQHKQDLMKLTQALVEKNTLLKSVADSNTTKKEIPENSTNFDQDMLNNKILTDSDWATFKTQFERSMPGYIQRLRAANSELSEAEERLFLLLKLNLKRKEIAGILGISPDSVKKTRSRLRKRLALTASENLENYIRNF